MTAIASCRSAAWPGGSAFGTAAVRLEQVSKVHQGRVRALDEVSLTVPPGTFLAVMGRSGSGKSSLLHCAAGLDVPTSGSVWISDTEISRLRETPRTQFRREHVGFVFQSYNLIGSLTVEENITLPLRLAQADPDRSWLATLTERTGVTEYLARLPGELSGGEQQRVAIVRALATRPDVVFADEPTGALDVSTGNRILELLDELVRDLGQTVVMVTHDPAAAARAQDTVVMADGRIQQLLRAPDAATLAALLGG